jgi:heme-degrading monooxygenase HmoA
VQLDTIARMFARVAAITTPGASREQGVGFFRDRVLPDLRRYAGFQDALLLVPPEGGEALVITLWDTEENLRDAEAAPAPHRTSGAREALGPEARRDVRVYEVAFRASAT